MSLHSAVALRLGGLIAQGKLAPGLILPNEATLGAEFGVSRTALREAIKVLASKGLVDVRRKTGTRITEHARWNMLDPEVLNWMFSRGGIPAGLADLMEVRMLVEPAAARMAAMRASAEDINEIRNSLTQMESATGSLRSSVDADLRFHMAVLQATHNMFMRPFGALIQAALRGSFRLTSSNTDLYRRTLPLHRKVLHAIETGGTHRAQTAMQAVLSQTLHDIEVQSEALSAKRDATKTRRTPKRNN
ncbi:MAG TPA: FadR/GntR family transcriptional regulator [Terracidiphilus sp.]|nr:FadR/GntR family transcriptional regulator [Terracidiphilus sp.]